MQSILSRIEDIVRTLGCALVGIDGRGGAGKSTLARNLAAALPSASVIEFDWFHLPRDRVGSGANYDFERFRTEVVEPFKSGASDLAFRRYNWGFLAGAADGLEPHVFHVPRRDVLLVEGCQVFDVRSADCFDLRIWVDTQADEALRRGMRRDIHEYGLDPVQVEQMWLEWTEREQRLLAEEDRRLKADLLF